MVSTAQSSAVDIEPAIKELAQGYDLTVRLHCILLAQKYEGRSATLDLVEKILQAFKSSLAVLKPHTSGYTRFEIKEAQAATAGKSNGKSGFSGDNGAEGGGAEHSRKRKGINEKSYKTVTSTPHHDGYQWRKYGEKKIRGTIFPRCYYRCTYLHDQHCQAIKQIQQLNSDDPPLYEVTYNRNHTCTNRSGSRRNGEDNKDGFPTCIVFGENEDEDDDVTIVSSSSTNSKEIDPAQLRQPTQIQDATKRAKTSSLTLGMGPTHSTAPPPAVTPPQPPAVTPPQPPAVSQPVSDPTAFLKRLNQEAAFKRSREAPVISPTPLSVAGPAQFSVVGPSQFANLPGGKPGLDPSLLRHLNLAEAAKRLRTSLNFSNNSTVGPAPSEYNNNNHVNVSNCNVNNVNNVNSNVGKSFPPFTFLSSRFEKMTSQNNQNNNNTNNSSNSNNNSNIESLFTLPSERQLNTSLNNNNNNNNNNQNPLVMERSSAARVRRSFSDNGNQMERSSARVNRVERSLSQSQMEANRNAPRQHSHDNSINNGVRKETEGFFTLSSMESSITNVANNSNKQMESVSRSSVERSSDGSPNDVRKNLSENQAEVSENKRVDSSGISENKEQIEVVFNPSQLERNSEKEKEQTNATESKEKQKEGLRTDTNPNPNPNSKSEGSSEMNREKPKLNREENEMESVLTLSSLERSKSADTNMNLSIKVDKNKNSVENQSQQMESMLRLSSLERTLNPKPKETTRLESQNRDEIDNFLSLSSMKRTGSCSNLKTQNQKEMEGMLSLSFSTGEDERRIEKRACDVNGEELDMNLCQKKSEMEGVLSLSSSMERSCDAQPILELNLPLTSAAAPPPPPPQSFRSEQNPNSSNEQNPNSKPPPTDQTSHLEATVADLQTKLNKSKEESTFTKQKVSDLESQISAIKATTEAWQRMMAEEASRRVAEAVSQLTSSLASSSGSNSLLEGSRRTEILFPGAVDEDESVVEVPSLLSQLDKNK